MAVLPLKAEQIHDKAEQRSSFILKFSNELKFMVSTVG
jgi:hypothetical protein